MFSSQTQYRPRQPRRPAEAAEALFAKGDVSEAPTAPVQVRLKFFDVEKGYGFAAALDGSIDYFIHASVAGDRDLPRGATLLVRVGLDTGRREYQGANRLNITEILSIDASTATPPREKLPPLKVIKVDYGKLSARTTGGFGFMSSDTGGGDVYLSPHRFQDPGMHDIAIGDAIEADVAIGKGGRLIATAVRRL